MSPSASLDGVEPEPIVTPIRPQRSLALPCRRVSRSLFALGLCLALVSCGSDDSPDDGKPQPVRARGPRTVDAAELDAAIDDTRGSVVVVNVWASWCQPCANEFVELAAFDLDHRRLGVEIVAISVDDPHVFDTAVKRFLEAQKPRFRVLLLKDGAIGPVRDRLDSTWDGSIPTTFILDRQGRLRTRLVGPQSKDVLAAKVAPLLR